MPGDPNDPNQINSIEPKDVPAQKKTSKEN